MSCPKALQGQVYCTQLYKSPDGKVLILVLRGVSRAWCQVSSTVRRGKLFPFPLITLDTLEYAPNTNS